MRQRHRATSIAREIHGARQSPGRTIALQVHGGQRYFVSLPTEVVDLGVIGERLTAPALLTLDWLAHRAAADAFVAQHRLPAAWIDDVLEAMSAVVVLYSSLSPRFDQYVDIRGATVQSDVRRLLSVHPHKQTAHEAGDSAPMASSH